jgi:hypothetical protein
MTYPVIARIRMMFACLLLAIETVVALVLAGQEALGTGSNVTISGETADFFQVTAASTGKVAALHVTFNTAITGEIRAALWTDSGSSLPLASLAEGSATDAGSSTTIEVSIAETEVTSGTKYWIAVWADPQIVIKGGTTTLIAKSKGGKKAKISEFKEWSAAESIGPGAAWATSAVEAGGGRLVMVV